MAPITVAVESERTPAVAITAARESRTANRQRLVTDVAYVEEQLVAQLGKGATLPAPGHHGRSSPRDRGEQLITSPYHPATVDPRR